MAGRPSDFNAEIAELFCERIATSERGVRRICEEDDDMPDEATIYRWIARHEQFREMYARAKDMQCFPIAERLRDVASDGRNDWMEIQDREGNCVGWRENGEALGRSRLRVDTDKWLLAKLAPKKYGDKIQQEVSGSLVAVHADAAKLAELPQADLDAAIAMAEKLAAALAK